LTEQPIYNEKELLRRVAEGDEKAFRRLFDGYRQKIYNLGMYLTRSETLAEEIVQDVFLKVWQKRQELTIIDFFNSWIRTVARNTSINYLRSLAVERLGLINLAGSETTDTNSPETSLANKEYAKILQEAITRLPPQQQKVWIMARQQGLKQEEIAKQLGISIFTVKEYMKLALRSIKTYLEKRIDVMVILGVALYLD
jgi:RNA polymerase sigma-70 factor (ECF subfamily)